MYEVLLRAAIPGFALRKPEEHPRYYRYSPEEEIVSLHSMVTTWR